MAARHFTTFVEYEICMACACPPRAPAQLEPGDIAGATAVCLLVCSAAAVLSLCTKTSGFACF